MRAFPPSAQRDASRILWALARGSFPMAEARQAREFHFIEPPMRAVVPLDRFHIPVRLRRTIRRAPFAVRIDHDFAGVVAACAAPGRGRETTWINRQIHDAYCLLHAQGHAHSVECRLDGVLAGGLYGVAVGGAFFGESMFTRLRDAGKIALVYLAARLIAGGFRLFDAQFLTEHLRQFGAEEIPAALFRRRLREARAVEADFYSLPDGADPAAVVHLTGHKS